MHLVTGLVAAPLVRIAGHTGWEGWPFRSPDGEFSFVTSAARVLFVLAVFALLAWGLRRLFGPGGPMRPKEFGTGHIAEREEKKRALAALRADHKAGRLSDAQFRDAEHRLRGQ